MMINLIREFNKMYLYTKRGIYHKQRNECSGDIVRGLDNGEFAVITLADGVSSCRFGAEGAGIISSCAMDYVYKQYSVFRAMPKEWPVFLLNILRKRLRDAVNNDRELYAEHSSTLMVIVIDRRRGIMYYCNIGDGILIAIDDNKCPIICMPQGDKSGCPVITTEGVEKKIASGILDLVNVKNIMMCSDGTWEMMYSHNKLKKEIKDILLKGDYAEFEEFIRKSDNRDDCSFAFADVRRVA